MSNSTCILGLVTPQEIMPTRSIPFGASFSLTSTHTMMYVTVTSCILVHLFCLSSTGSTGTDISATPMPVIDRGTYTSVPLNK